MDLIDCSNIIVRQTIHKGLGAFARNKIPKGKLVEKGIIRRIDYDGNENPYLFTWSDNKDVWGFASGCATFYNTSKDPNTIVNRYYDGDRFEIYAIKDIDKNEELTHIYKSLEWRKCFSDLREMEKL